MKGYLFPSVFIDTKRIFYLSSEFYPTNVFKCRLRTTMRQPIRGVLAHDKCTYIKFVIALCHACIYDSPCHYSFQLLYPVITVYPNVAFLPLLEQLRHLDSGGEGRVSIPIILSFVLNALMST